MEHRAESVDIFNKDISLDLTEKVNLAKFLRKCKASYWLSQKEH